jgi:hypothetical protein
MYEGEQRIGFFPACGVVELGNPDRLEDDTRAQVRAAGELFGSRTIDKVVFTAGHIAPNGQKVNGVLLADRMVSHLYRTFEGFPRSDAGAHLEYTTMAESTEEEVRDFREMASRRNWRDILVVRSEKFAEQVDRAMSLAFPRVPTISYMHTEHVLKGAERLPVLVRTNVAQSGMIPVPVEANR